MTRLWCQIVLHANRSQMQIKDLVLRALPTKKPSWWIGKSHSLKRKWTKKINNRQRKKHKCPPIGRRWSHQTSSGTNGTLKSAKPQTPNKIQWRILEKICRLQKNWSLQIPRLALKQFLRLYQSFWPAQLSQKSRPRTTSLRDRVI